MRFEEMARIAAAASGGRQAELYRLMGESRAVRRRVRALHVGAQQELFDGGELPRGPATREPRQEVAF